jgi:hypothetical protein
MLEWTGSKVSKNTAIYASMQLRRLRIGTGDNLAGPGPHLTCLPAAAITSGIPAHLRVIAWLLGNVCSNLVRTSQLVHALHTYLARTHGQCTQFTRYRFIAIS